MAKVNMDLAELKQLESKIEKLEKDKQDLIDKQHQVVIYHKYFNGRIKVGKFPKGNVHSVDSISIRGKHIYNDWGNGPTLAYFDREIPLQQALDNGLVEIDITEDSSRHTKDYKNMSDVISDIKHEEESKVRELLQKSLDRATKAEYEITTVEDKYKKKILESTDYYNKRIDELNSKIQTLTKNHEEEVLKLNSVYSKNLKELTTTKDEQYSKLQQEFEDFKADKKQISLEEQIIELKAIIENYKSKGFWQRILKND